MRRCLQALLRELFGYKMKTPEDILQFWFSDKAAKLWFRSSDAFDAEIRREFESTALALAASQATAKHAHEWEEQSPEAHLALIVSLDQFPRNMYRNTAAAFAWDKYALRSAKRMIARRSDLHLAQRQRPFAYMPYMHSEALADQEDCVRLSDARLEAEGTLKAALQHRDIIAAYGRFPHRNAVLGRKSTPEETAFLEAGGFSG